MPHHSRAHRFCAALCLAFAFLVLPGCADLPKPIVFLQHRFEDLCEIVDVGVTVTLTPQWGFYWNSLDIFPVGYSDIDGYFVGVGGGHFLLARHSNHCYGLGVGIEKIGWSGNLDPFRSIPDENIMKRMSGILGIASAILGIGPYGAGPNYTPACVHFFPHIGFVGLVWNARYTEFVDFAVGWVGLDIAGDDGRKVGYWNIPLLTPKWDEEQDKTDPDTDKRLSPPASVRSSREDARATKSPPSATEMRKPTDNGRCPAIVGATSQAARAAEKAADREKPQEPAPPPGQRVYIVQPGDVGIMEIAEKQLGSVQHWHRIVELNNLEPPYEIRPGQRLLLPE